MIEVTGGAGFIGSRIVETLRQEHQVMVVDDLSSGSRENVPEEAVLVEKDINDLEAGDLEDVETVFHFAANPEVNTFPRNRERDFRDNAEGTKSVLDACTEADVDELVFASSSVVYGEEAEIPTPETAKFDPISMYAATKCSAEHMCQVYSQILDLDITILRYANIVGPRNEKGVIYDFFHKLRDDPEQLEILGNGKQRKSYLYIDDAVDATLKAWKAPGTVYNVGSRDSVSVDEIAEIVSEVMGLDPEFSYTGGERGWKGDVPEMRLSIEKLEDEGWRPEHDSESSVRKTAEELLEKL
ncbi:MAG: NAD-dependent epimerase/dehydratase family protein [Candidatus Nanohaloarchaea archaeon]